MPKSVGRKKKKLERLRMFHLLDSTASSDGGGRARDTY